MNINKIILDSKLKFVTYNVKKSDVENILMEMNQNSNEIVCAFASAQYLSDKNVEIELIFDAVSEGKINDRDLSFCHFILDDVPLLETLVAIEHEPNVPDKWYLGQNYPNPFNFSCIFEYHVPKKSHVTVEIFNLLGQKVRTLIRNKPCSGLVRLRWDGVDDRGGDLPSGIYFCRVKTERKEVIRKMLYVR